ncbi:MAG TPA: hypothetical protein VM120_15485 [Bryobacteraceae bacterium]|nr:hypothetical protein [Bryobacteraceae bacterium]
MPYCTQCGGTVSDRDVFCARCGSPQRPVSAGAAHHRPNFDDVPGSINRRTAALLCYIPVIGWIAAICVLAAVRFRDDREIRFHAFQGLYLFVAWLLVDWVMRPIFVVSHFPFHFPFVGAAKAVLFGSWIWMMIKTAHNQTFKLPIVGDLAEKSAAEQR